MMAPPPTSASSASLLFPNLPFPTATVSPGAIAGTSNHTAAASASPPMAAVATAASPILKPISTAPSRSSPPMDPSHKRKRSTSIERPSHSLSAGSHPPPAKTARTATATSNSAPSTAVMPSAITTTTPTPNTNTATSSLQINYLARQYSDILPLISADDTLPSLIALIADYGGVLQRHESMAGNLGARPLGPILIQRFERLFDGAPRVLSTNGTANPSTTASPAVNPIGWLDVVEFARATPEHFTLQQSRDGIRVCQFNTKGSRVQISEEDFLLISSGIPQKMIPPQPIAEDEEKELGTLEILERNVGAVVHLADQVSAQARQLNHRLNTRRTAIIRRRSAESASSAATAKSGFVAVNAPSATSPAINGSGASAATKAELLSHFHTTNSVRGHVSANTPAATTASTTSTTSKKTNSIAVAAAPLANNNNNNNNNHTTQTSSDRERRVSRPLIRPTSSASLIAKSVTAAAEPAESGSGSVDSPSPVPTAKPAPSLNIVFKTGTTQNAAERLAESGPYKAEMMRRMEQLHRGDRVHPSCDRCRRLGMECRKNLTACMGCTRKHAKCSWKDVSPPELENPPFVGRGTLRDPRARSGTASSRGEDDDDMEWSRDNRRRKKTTSTSWRHSAGEVRDEELLGEDDDDEDDDDDEEEDDDARDGSRSGFSPVASTINPPRVFTAHEWDTHHKTPPAKVETEVARPEPVSTADIKVNGTSTMSAVVIEPVAVPVPKTNGVHETVVTSITKLGDSKDEAEKSVVVEVLPDSSQVTKSETESLAIKSPDTPGVVTAGPRSNTESGHVHPSTNIPISSFLTAQAENQDKAIPEPGQGGVVNE